MKLVDLVGRQFCRLTVVERAENNQRGHTRWLCKCQCGATTVVGRSELVSGNTKSCGCYRREALDRTTHGLKGSPEYRMWQGMKKRCYDEGQRSYKDYGGRGITVCPEWVNDPVAFADYVRSVLGPKPTPSHSLDRKDNNGNYEPGNLRWATTHEQARNQRPKRRRKLD